VRRGRDGLERGDAVRAPPQLLRRLLHLHRPDPGDGLARRAAFGGAGARGDEAQAADRVPRLAALVIAYKFLAEDGTGVFSRFRWPIGEWVEADVDPCRSGVHGCRPRDLPYWIAPALYETELE